MKYICQFKDGGKYICGEDFEDLEDAHIHLECFHNLIKEVNE